MQFIFKANVEADPDGGYLVTFADVPEAITHGDSLEEARTNAQEALGLALRGIVQEGGNIPRPAAMAGEPIAVDAEDAIKLAVIEAFREAKISQREFARRLGKAENEVRRILDPDHRSKLSQLQDAMHVLGKTIVVSVLEAA
ncbi:UNVERIFIED_ORG: antitoxin HicB [Rhizobium sophorae]|uniref:type II toxin-antitoxin system HicB family antitoxin n=1 Tax=Rhizobium leguminosarum TaxID=384 RepID=UPI001607501E|nr:type II toxin-antitoxin system HicB family antitoxin [Rhizobium leguminosarum]MBB4520499.1 antitoxin HicB [Rhizobium leguminosarum]MDH6658380.1 antitoxin HicB [Rhizobium sophorae]